MRNFFPPEHHDFVGTSEIRQLEADNRAIIEADFLYGVEMLRVNALSKLAEHQALDDAGTGWAIFLLPPEDEFMMPREVLLRVTDDGLNDVPASSLTVRIITNQLFTYKDVPQWFTVDFIADQDNDTQYLVDAVDLNSAKSIGETYSPLIGVTDDGKLKLVNGHGFTPILDVLHATRPEDRIMPFGHCMFMQDKVDALAVGQELFALICNIEPACASA